MGDILEELQEISAELDEFSITVGEDILIKIKEFCQVYGLKAEAMVGSWIAFSATNNCNMEPTLELLEQFEKVELMKKSGKAIKHRKSYQSHLTKPVYNSTTIDQIENDCYENLEQGTPEKAKYKQLSNNADSPAFSFSPNSFSPVQIAPSPKYVSRNTSGKVVCSYGNTENASWACNDQFSCTIVPYNEGSALQSRYTYMFEKLRDYASVLNDMIEDMAQQFQNKYGVTEWGHIQLPAVDTVSVVGRICSDGNGKLNTVSIVLEGSQESSSGQVVPVDVTQLQKFSFFPGQIIAGQGINSLGKKFTLTDVYEGNVLGFSEEPPDFGNSVTDSLSVVIAAGPYATSGSLSYEPLADLLKYVKVNKPHVCILCGPLVDTKHESIELGNLSETYQDIFQRILTTIMNSIEGTNTMLILLPSARDAHHDPVYPIPPFQVKQQYKNLYLASDPCLLKINGVVFGITSTDILLHLGKEEISFPPQSTDRLGRLCSHLLTQKNFYPLYPSNEDINIDYVHFESHCLLSVTPHILIIPSDLRHFIKDVNGCCCVNPERLTKHFVGGTFARLKIRPINSTNYSGSIMDYIQAEIVKV